MNRTLRALCLACSLALLVACQQAARPDLAAHGDEPPAAAIPAAPATSAPEAVLTASGPAPAGMDAAAVSDATPGAGGPEAATTDDTPLDHGQDVFARISSRLSPGVCLAGNNSARWRQRYAANPAAFSNHLEQILPLLDFVSVEVERAGLPAEFSFIPLVESWYRPEAIGPGGPAGMWQMIASTARNHGIHIQPGYDGRLSPVESTRAALSYLKTLQDMFGDWQAIVMAYNAGEGRVQGAFKHANTRRVSADERKPHGLSNITYDYVAKLQALSCLVAEPEKHGVQLPASAQFVPLAPVLMGSELKTLDQFAAAHAQDASVIRRLNPGYKGGRIVAGVPRLVLTPFGLRQAPAPSPLLASGDVLAVNDAPAAAAPTDGPALTHQVRAGDSLWSIAKLYRMTIEQLRRLNGLRANSAVYPGQTLKLVP